MASDIKRVIEQQNGFQAEEISGSKFWVVIMGMMMLK